MERAERERFEEEAAMYEEEPNIFDNMDPDDAEAFMAQLWRGRR